jgi:hypothetical protein
MFGKKGEQRMIGRKIKEQERMRTIKNPRNIRRPVL